MIASNMEVIANELWNELYIFVASATRALKKLLRQCRRSPWFPLLAVAGGALLGIVAIKLIALLGAAFDISFLRDVGNNVNPGAAAGGGGAGVGGGAAGGGSGGGSGDPPPYHDPYLDYPPNDGKHHSYQWKTGDDLAPIFGGTSNHPHPPPSEPWFSSPPNMVSIVTGRRGGEEAGQSAESLRGYPKSSGH